MEDDDHIKIWGVKIKTNYIWLFIVVILVGWFVISKYWGYEEIGKFGEKRDYTAQYWVYLQPENAEAKNYKVKADIQRILPDYYLKRVYWPNGGYSDFDDCLLDEEEYQNNGHIYCIPEGEDTGYNIQIYLTDKVRE